MRYHEELVLSLLSVCFGMLMDLIWNTDVIQGTFEPQNEVDSSAEQKSNPKKPLETADVLPPGQSVAPLSRSSLKFFDEEDLELTRVDWNFDRVKFPRG